MQITKQNCNFKKIFKCLSTPSSHWPSPPSFQPTCTITPCTEKGVTRNSDDPSALPLLSVSKVELAHPKIDVDSYLLARNFGLAPEQKFSWFKMVQSLLPNKERLARIGKVPSPACNLCQAQEDNTLHLLSCTQC